MIINHKEVIDTNFYSISSRMAVLIEEMLFRNHTILHTSISGDQHRFYGTVIYKEFEE